MLNLSVCRPTHKPAVDQRLRAAPYKKHAAACRRPSPAGRHKILDQRPAHPLAVDVKQTTKSSPLFTNLRSCVVKKIATIGLDIAKNVFQVHAADADGSTVFNRKIKRADLLEFFAKLPPCWSVSRPAVPLIIGLAALPSSAMRSVGPSSLCEALCEAGKERFQ